MSGEKGRAPYQGDNFREQRWDLFSDSSRTVPAGHLVFRAAKPIRGNPAAVAAGMARSFQRLLRWVRYPSLPQPEAIRWWQLGAHLRYRVAGWWAHWLVRRFSGASLPVTKQDMGVESATNFMFIEAKWRTAPRIARYRVAVLARICVDSSDWLDTRLAWQYARFVARYRPMVAQ